MQEPGDGSFVAQWLRDELIGTLMNTLADGVAMLSPAARLRLLAFLHLADRPDAITADFELDPSGPPRLVLRAITATAHSPGAEPSQD
jgi:hypothetical protein